MFNLAGVTKASPDQKLYLNTTAAATRRLRLFERTVLVDASAGANTLTITLPAQGMASDMVFTVRVAGSTGGVLVQTENGANTWSISAGTTTETMAFFSDGYEYRVIEDNAD